MFGFGAAASTAPDHQQALDEVVPAVLGQVGEAPDLVVCFLSMDHADAATGISLGLSERTGTATIIGCTAGGVIGGRHELEDSPALSVWAARLPGVRATPFALDLVELADGYGVTGWPELDPAEDRKSTRLNSSHPSISYAVFCLKKTNHPAPCVLPPASQRAAGRPRPRASHWRSGSTGGRPPSARCGECVQSAVPVGWGSR